MIHSHTHGKHTFVCRDDSEYPGTVRILGSGANLDTIMHYADEGYSVQIGTPEALQDEDISEELHAGAGGCLANEIYPYIDRQLPEHGGWRDVTSSDYRQLRAHQAFLKMAHGPFRSLNGEHDWGAMTGDYHGSEIARYLRGFFVDTDWAAVFLASLCDPRWFVDPADPGSPERILDAVRIQEDMQQLAGRRHQIIRLRRTALAFAIFGEGGPMVLTAAARNTPFGWAFFSMMDDDVYREGSTADKIQLALGATRAVTVSAAHYAWRRWYCLVCDVEFDPAEVFDERGVAFYEAHSW